MPQYVLPGGNVQGARPGLRPGRAGRLSVTPSKVMAAVGSEVVLLAGVCGTDQHLVTRQPMQWMLSQDSPGHFVQVGDEGRPWWRKALGCAPKKISNNYALGRTTTFSQIITRGTAAQNDDIWLAAGQAWISVTSPVAGTSYVTAVAPKTDIWEQRRQTAVIHWVDAQWVIPPPIIGRTGQTHTLTTTVSRHNGPAPVSGWLVRYEIVDGPPAGFAPNGAKMVEVRTDGFGKASARITGSGTQGGVSRIRIQIIRPAGPGGAGRQVIGEDWTLVTWSAANLSVLTGGPQTADVDSTITYRVDVTNRGDLPARQVVVSDVMPPQMSFVGSTPKGGIFGNRIEWRIGDLAPGQTSRIEIQCRAVRQGEARHCVTARSADGLAAEGCATTRISMNALSVSMTGPDKAEVGQKVQYHVTVTNRSDLPLKKVMLRDEYDPGLRHAGVATPGRPIQQKLGELAAGEKREFAVTFTVQQPGRHCHRLLVTAEGGHSATATGCVTAKAAAAVQPEPQPGMSVSKTGPKVSSVGQIVEFRIEVRNTGNMPLTNVRIVDQFAPALQPKNATDGFKVEEGRLVWTVDRIAPGESVAMRVQCETLAEERSACNRATVTADPNLAMADEQCVRIDPKEPAPAIPDDDHPPVVPPSNGHGADRSGTLKLTVVDLDDPLRVGGSTTYLITIENDRDVADKNVTLSFTVPAKLRFEKFTSDDRRMTVKPEGPGSRTLTVTPIAELRPGESVTVRVETTATAAGLVRFRAKLESLRLTEPVETTTDTTIFIE